MKQVSNKIIIGILLFAVIFSVYVSIFFNIEKEGAVTMSKNRINSDSEIFTLLQGSYLKSGDRMISENKLFVLHFKKGFLQVNRYKLDRDGEFMLRNNIKIEEFIWRKTIPSNLDVMFLSNSGILNISKGSNVKPYFVSDNSEPANSMIINDNGSMELLSKDNKRLWILNGSIGRLKVYDVQIDGYENISGLLDDLNNEPDINNASGALSDDVLKFYENDRRNNFLNGLPDLSENVDGNNRKTEGSDVFNPRNLTSAQKEDNYFESRTNLDFLTSNYNVIDGNMSESYPSCKELNGQNLIICNNKQKNMQRKIQEDKLNEMYKMGDTSNMDEGILIDNNAKVSVLLTVLTSCLIFYTFTF